MKIIYPFLITIILQNYLFAFSDQYIADAIKKISKKEEIDVRIIYTIVQIESNFKPFAISMTTSEKNAKEFQSIKNPHIKIYTKEYSLNKNKWIVSFYPENLAYAKALARAFKKQNFSFDVGIAQINTTNFNIEEIDYIFDPIYNLTKSSKVLKDCQKIKKDLKSTIECYNFGTKERGSYPYYNKFKTTYSKNFGA